VTGESGRIPGAGPTPADSERTLEQKAFLGVGTAFLFASAFAAAELVYRLTIGRSPIVVAFPLLYLALGWISLLFGLAKLSGAHRVSSAARGPWLAAGALIVFVCAPIPASVLYPATECSVTSQCEDCGQRGRARGTQNYWGGWLEQTYTPLGISPPLPGQRWSKSPSTCDHPGCLPWED
jgi:hypothetical protein